MDYLQQFKNLPRELREAVSSEEKIRQLEEIEKKYNLKLTKLVVRIMVKDVSWSEVEKFCQENFHLSPERTAELKKDLTEKIFSEVRGYLGAKKQIETNRNIPAAAAKQVEIYPPKVDEISRNMSPSVTKYAPPSRETEPVAEGKEEINFKKIVQEAKNILTGMAPATSVATAEPEKIVKEIKQKLNLVFEDEILERRFENIISSYLKEIRNEIQTEETLKRAKKIGGLEFLPEKAALVIRIAKEFKGRLTQKAESRKQRIEETPKSAITETMKRAIAEAQKPVTAEPQKPLIREAQKVSEIQKTSEPRGLPGEQTEEARPKTNKEIQQRFASGAILPTFKKIEKPIREKPTPAESQKVSEPQKISEIQRSQEKPTEIDKKIHIQIRQPISGERLTDDIARGAPRAVGPVDDLADITLTDLQRWGGGQKTAQIILDKINLLQEISLIKKEEGIRAWQRSPLAKLYIAIGRQALEQKKSIHQIIKERENNNQPSLKIEDFEAINELNQKLRF